MRPPDRRRAAGVAAPRGRGRPPGGADPAGRPAAVGVLAVAAAALLAGCFDPGEPTPGEARVTWAAYPETVLVGERFSLEAAGPLAPDNCSRFDTLMLEVSDSALALSARRLVYTEAWCTDDRRSFYRVQPVTLRRPGRYPVRAPSGVDLGAVVALDSGTFSPVRAVGLGTVRRAGGCLFFGPGWAHAQRPFPLLDAPDRLRRVAGTDTVVRVTGRLYGYRRCGGYGSRPAIRVDSVRITDRTGAGWFP